MAEKWEELRDNIIGIVTNRVREFVEGNVNVKAFLEERAGRLAKLAVERMRPDGTDKAHVEAQMGLVTDTIENDVAALEITAAKEAASVFSAVLQAVGDMLKGALPLLGGLVG